MSWYDNNGYLPPDSHSVKPENYLPRSRGGGKGKPNFYQFYDTFIDTFCNGTSYWINVVKEISQYLNDHERGIYLEALE